MSNEKRIQIEELAKQHPEYDAELVSAELDAMESMDVIDHLFALLKKCQSENGQFDKNELNSISAYLIGVTSQKPVGTFKLEKRRTYARPGFPDIDMDFDYLRRHEIVEYLIRKYGRECVGNIGTIQTLKTKAAVRRAIKLLDPTNTARYDEKGKIVKQEYNANFALENEILDCLPNIMKKEDGNLIKTIAEACKEYPQFDEYMKKYPEVKRVASSLENMISGYGCHAAGLVLSPVPLSQLCPLHVTTDKNADLEDNATKIIATQFTMSEVERLGLIKLDVLGLSTLSALSMAVKLIKENTDKAIDWFKIPLDDKKTFELLSSGKTDGVFQAEEYGMKETLKQIGIDGFDDIAVCISMFRPGPMQYINEYANRKHGRVQVRYDHPIMKKITEKTFGIIAYQEQVMRAFVEMSGLSESDGYMFIKGVGKKKKDIIESYQEKFVKGCIGNGIDINVANKIYDDTRRFAGYAFNLAHAVSYAYLCYQTAYLKAHYPAEFFAARLTVETIRRKFDYVAKCERDAVRNFGMKISPADINKSGTTWKIIGDKHLLKPLLAKGLGVKAASEIVKHQPYVGDNIFEAFVKKAGSFVNSKSIEAMCDAGLWQIPKVKAVERFNALRKCIKKSKNRPLMSMF